MTDFPVILNPCRNGQYENGNRCFCCGKLADTVRINWLRFCDLCLEQGLKALKQARLEHSIDVYKKEREAFDNGCFI